MVAQQQAPVKRPAPVKHLLDQSILRSMERSGTYHLDLVGFDFVHPTCEARAAVRGLAEGLKVLHLGPNHYAVSSGSRPGEGYSVRVWGERFACDCDAGRSKKVCKHAELVRRELARRQAQAEEVAF